MAVCLPLLAYQLPFLADSSFINCTWLVFGKRFAEIDSADVPLLPYPHLSVPTPDGDTVLHNAPTHLPMARGWLHLFIPRLLPGLNPQHAEKESGEEGLHP